MKKILLFSVCMLISAVSTRIMCDTHENKKPSRWSTAFSAGYVFKQDCEFKEVYGRGIVNMITADVCYHFWKHWGLDAKISYWRAKGKTTFLQQHTLVQEVPFTLSVRGMKHFGRRVQLYASLGGGFVWTKEKSYLACERIYKGVGEVEVGLNYSLCRCAYLTGAFRYIFPPKSVNGERADVGGCDLRAGIGFSF